MHCRRSDHNGGQRRQRGAALVVAMLIFALSTALIVAMRSEFERFFQRSANILDDAQIQAFLRAGEELAAIVLIQDYDQDKQEGVRDDLDEIWNSPEVKRPFPLEGIGWFQGELEDLQGRFNLNNLLVERTEQEGSIREKRYSQAQQQFIRLLQALGEPAVSELEAIAITESISDWLDPDQETVGEGAEDSYYFGRTPAYRAGNRLMSSVSELRAVANVTPEIFHALSPWITVLPSSDTKLNVLTAPPMLLRTINEDKNLSPLSEDDGVTLRDSAFADINELLANPLFPEGQGKMDAVKPVLGMSSEYFLLTASVEVAGRQMRLYSVLERRNRTVGAIARAAGSPCPDVEKLPPDERGDVETFCAIPL